MHATTLVILGVAIGAMGFYVANADDAPGAAVIGLLLMVVGVVLGVRAARHRLRPWVARTSIVVGIVVAAFAAFLSHGVTVMAPLFAQAQAVPSAVAAAPAPEHAAAVERARALVRSAIRDQNLPGVSVAVAARGAIVWAEGFGWRDVATQSPVTPTTRFHIGDAASAVVGRVGPLGLTNTGTDTAADWSPEHVGEEEEDFPPLAILRHAVFQPLGLMAAEYPLPGERATFYVPREDDNPARGRQLMYMRDLACCVDGKAFSSTPSDLVRVGSATSASDVHGKLAGGTVMSLVTRPDSRVVVAVASNIAHANTPALARRIADSFEGRGR